MSFGALSANAIEALNGGAARGGFAHDTGEGGISPYHLRARRRPDLGDRFGLLRLPRRRRATSTPRQFAEKARLPAVKAISIKLSQGAKPGLGGVLPGAKVSAEIAATRGVPVGQHRRLAARAHRVRHAAGVHGVHRDAAPTVRRQAGRLQALRRRPHRVPVHLQGHAGHRHHPGLHHRRRLRGRNRRGPTGIRGPRRDAADRGPDVGAQQPRRRRTAGPDQDRRVGQGRQRRRHRQADHARAPTSRCRPGR